MPRNRHRNAKFSVLGGGEYGSSATGGENRILEPLRVDVMLKNRWTRGQLFYRNATKQERMSLRFCGSCGNEYDGRCILMPGIAKSWLNQVGMKKTCCAWRTTKYRREK